MMVIPEYIVYGLGIGVLVFGLLFVSYFSRVRNNPLARAALAAEKEGRMALIHYPSGSVVPAIPELEPQLGKQSPTWNIDGTKRFKDNSGEKWETVGNIKLIHYTARGPTPIATNYAIAADQFEEMLNNAGFNITGIKKEVFDLIAEGSKGEEYLKTAWNNMSATGSMNSETKSRIKAILKYLAQNPELKLTMFKSGAFTYQTVVHIIDQIIADTVSEISDLISHTEDRVRRQGQQEGKDMLKFLQWAGPLILLAAIGAATFLIAIGKVG
jgi:hypothetical protein